MLHFHLFFEIIYFIKYYTKLFVTAKIKISAFLLHCRWFKLLCNIQPKNFKNLMLFLALCAYFFLGKKKAITASSLKVL